MLFQAGDQIQRESLRRNVDGGGEFSVSPDWEFGFLEGLMEVVSSSFIPLETLFINQSLEQARIDELISGGESKGEKDGLMGSEGIDSSFYSCKCSAIRSMATSDHSAISAILAHLTNTIQTSIFQPIISIIESQSSSSSSSSSSGWNIPTGDGKGMDFLKSGIENVLGEAASKLSTTLTTTSLHELTPSKLLKGVNLTTKSGVSQESDHFKAINLLSHCLDDLTFLVDTLSVELNKMAQQDVSSSSKSRMSIASMEDLARLNSQYTLLLEVLKEKKNTEIVKIIFCCLLFFRIR